jgi:AraC family transcriptional regulator
VQQKRSSIPSPLLSSVGRGWTGIEVARYTGYFGEISLPPFPNNHTVSIHLHRHPLDLMHRLDGRIYEERYHHGDIAIIPPTETPSEWDWRGRVKSDVLNLRLNNALLREVAESVEVDPDSVEIVPRHAVPDPQIEWIGLSLKAEVEAEGLLGGRLFAESLANALAISFIRDHSSLGRKAVRKAARELTGGLSKRALKSAIDYIGDNLANKDLTLAEVADAAHMSPYHFSRLFKESTGLSPHRYVIERRVQRAKELLRSTALPIAEIALLCGFANQSHLNRHFKRLFGVNPKALR